jgi:hypothetical protein
MAETLIALGVESPGDAVYLGLRAQTALSDHGGSRALNKGEYHLAPTPHAGVLSACSSQYQWAERVAAWDAHVDAEDLAEILDEAKAWRKTRRQASGALASKMIGGLRSVDFNSQSPANQRMSKSFVARLPQSAPATIRMARISSDPFRSTLPIRRAIRLSSTRQLRTPTPWARPAPASTPIMGLERLR